MLLTSTSIYSQDVIVKKDGSTILSKVLEVGEEYVKYKKWSNTQGADYTIKVTEILSINYENGDKDDFSTITNAPKTSTKPAAGVIPTKPATAPDIAPSIVGFPTI